jgi:hypothetical protein
MTRENSRCLLHYRQRQIIPIAAFVTGLVSVVANGNGSAIGQITEGPSNWGG